MASLHELPAGDVQAYHAYLLPSLSLLPGDGDEAVRVEYARAVAQCAAAAHVQLLATQDLMQGDGASGSFPVVAVDAAAASSSRAVRAAHGNSTAAATSAVRWVGWHIYAYAAGSASFVPMPWMRCRCM